VVIMTRTEERLQDALHAAASRVNDDRLRPLPALQPGPARRPGPARNRGRLRRAGRSWAGPAAAAASVVLVVGVVMAVTGGLRTSAGPGHGRAADRTLTQSYHLSEQDSYYFIVHGQIRNPHHDACTTEADPARHLLTASCSTWNPMTGKAGPIAREVGGYTYYYTPVTTGTHGKHWTRVLTASLPPPPCCADNGFTIATPQQMLAQIKKAATVTVAGPASGPGWTGTRYAFSATLRDGTKLSGTVTVDRQGRTRALVLTQRTSGAGHVLVETQVLTFSGFGAPVTVTPPPADQTWEG
jgi:hypothetical protein